MSPFYTRGGDEGMTGLLGKGRVPKYDLRMEALGALDESTAALGLAKAFSGDQDTRALLERMQRYLYQLMAEVAATVENAEKFRKITADQVVELEQLTDALEQQVALPNEFILPGDSPAGGALDLARTIIRRAERRVAELLAQNALQNQELLRFLNRLSSLIYLLEFKENLLSGNQHPTLAKE